MDAQPHSEQCRKRMSACMERGARVAHGKQMQEDHQRKEEKKRERLDELEDRAMVTTDPRRLEEDSGRSAI